MSVFIHADMDKRIKRIVKKYELTDAAAKDRIQKTDKKRAAYYNYYTSKKWGEASSYNLSLDSGILGVEGCVEMMKHMIELKKEQVNKLNRFPRLEKHKKEAVVISEMKITAASFTAFLYRMPSLDIAV